MNDTPDSAMLLPGSNHEVTVADGAFQLRQSVDIAVRYRTGPVGAALMVALLFVPLILVTFLMGQKLWALGMLAGALALAALAASFFKYRPAPARHPLIIRHGGQIDYRGRVIRPAGPVAVVRAYRIDGGDGADTFHVECIAPNGQTTELPRRFFKKAEPKEISGVIPWLGHVLGAQPKDELQTFPLGSAGYQRKRSPAQGGHGPGKKKSP